MSLQLPDELLDLEANGGIFAVWMLMQNCAIQVDIQTLVQLCKHDSEDGTFTIGLAVGLKKLGFDIVFHTAEDPNIHFKEIEHYTEANRLGLAIEQPLTYQDIQTNIEQGYAIVVYYDTLEGLVITPWCIQLMIKKYVFMIVLIQCKKIFLNNNARLKVFANRSSSFVNIVLSSDTVNFAFDFLFANRNSQRGSA